MLKLRSTGFGHLNWILTLIDTLQDHMPKAWTNHWFTTWRGNQLSFEQTAWSPFCWGTRSHANHVSSSSRAASQSSCSSSPRAVVLGGPKKSSVRHGSLKLEKSMVGRCFFSEKIIQLWRWKDFGCLSIGDLSNIRTGNLGAWETMQLEAGLEMTFLCLAKQSHSMNGFGKETYIIFWIIYWK